MDTLTKTKTITKTKILIATLALAATGGLAFILVPRYSVNNATLSINKTTYTCSDSDGGNNPFVKGTTTIKDQFGTIKSTNADYCANFSQLNERTCDDGGLSSPLPPLTTPCANGCILGICLPTTTP